MIWFRTKDHPASAFADGNSPLCWNVDIEADSGETVRIHVGAESRLKMLEMLAEDKANNPN